VAAIVKFITHHGNFKVLISIHSYSQMLMYPYGHSLDPVSNYEELVSLAAKRLGKEDAIPRKNHIWPSPREFRPSL
jgi:hypothetical protein